MDNDELLTMLYCLSSLFLNFHSFLLEYFSAVSFKAILRNNCHQCPRFPLMFINKTFVIKYKLLNYCVNIDISRITKYLNSSSTIESHIDYFPSAGPSSDLWTSFYNFYLWILLFAFLFIAFSAFFNEPRRARHPLGSHIVVFVFALF